MSCYQDSLHLGDMSGLESALCSTAKDSVLICQHGNPTFPLYANAHGILLPDLAYQQAFCTLPNPDRPQGFRVSGVCNPPGRHLNRPGSGAPVSGDAQSGLSQPCTRAFLGAAKLKADHKFLMLGSLSGCTPYTAKCSMGHPQDQGPSISHESAFGIPRATAGRDAQS